MGQWGGGLERWGKGPSARPPAALASPAPRSDPEGGVQQEPITGLCDLPRDVMEHMLVHFGGARAAASLASTCRAMRAMVVGEGILAGWMAQRREDDLLPEGIGSVGGVVTLYGVVHVTRSVRVGAGVHLTVRGGRLESTLGADEGGLDHDWSSDDEEESDGVPVGSTNSSAGDAMDEDEDAPLLYAFVVERGGSLVLEDVQMVGVGVEVCGGGTARLVGCDVLDAPADGVVALGEGSGVEVEGGSVSGSRGDSGISIWQGGHAVVKGVRVMDNQQTGVNAHGHGSRVEVEGGSVSGSKEWPGISAGLGGHAVVTGVQISNCDRHGISAGIGGHVVVTGVQISNCARCREIERWRERALLLLSGRRRLPH